MRALLAALLCCLAASLLPVVARAEPADAAATPTPAAQHVLLLLRLPQDHYRAGSAYSGAYGDSAAHGARRRVAAALARDHGLSLATDWALPLLGVDCYVMRVPSDQEPEQVAQSLTRDPRVAWAQAMHVYRAQGHNDPLYPLQPAARAWHLSQLHETTTGRDVRVAIVDSRIDERHPDLAGQVALKENFVDGHPDAPEQHGTAVAGIIAARADNGVGIAGVAPNARLLALRACWEDDKQTTLCNSLTLALALHYAIDHDAAVINMSLAGPPDRLLARLIDAALARGITVVGAVDTGLAGGGFPASHPGVVAVANSEGPPSAPPALRAPGRDIPTTAPHDAWNFVSGTSYAAAHVSGLFALLREGWHVHAPQALGTGAVSTANGEVDACATLARVAGAGACVRTMTSATPSIVRR